MVGGLQTVGPVGSLSKYDGDRNESEKINRFRLGKQQLHAFCFYFFLSLAVVARQRETPFQVLWGEVNS